MQVRLSGVSLGVTCGVHPRRHMLMLKMLSTAVRAFGLLLLWSARNGVFGMMRRRQRRKNGNCMRKRWSPVATCSTGDAAAQNAARAKESRRIMMMTQCMIASQATSVIAVKTVELVLTQGIGPVSGALAAAVESGRLMV